MFAARTSTPAEDSWSRKVGRRIDEDETGILRSGSVGSRSTKSHTPCPAGWYPVRNDDHAAQAHLFLGSPTVRVDGRDVEPGADERQPDVGTLGQDLDEASSPYGLQCRLYPTASGSLTGTPRDEWIVDALLSQDHPGADNLNETRSGDCQDH